MQKGCWRALCWIRSNKVLRSRKRVWMLLWLPSCRNWGARVRSEEWCTPNTRTLSCMKARPAIRSIRPRWRPSDRPASKNCCTIRSKSHKKCSTIVCLSPRKTWTPSAKKISLEPFLKKDLPPTPNSFILTFRTNREAHPKIATLSSL